MITIEDGDILDNKYKIICHQVNTLGIMGAGLARQIKNKYPECYSEYSNLCRKYNSLNRNLLGATHYYLSSDKIIFNLFAQNRVSGQVPRTNYEALCESLDNTKYTLETKLHNYFKDYDTLAIPYGIGCGLAGGDWDGVVYPMIQNIFKDAPFDVVIVKNKLNTLVGRS